MTMYQTMILDKRKCKLQNRSSKLKMGTGTMEELMHKDLKKGKILIDYDGKNSLVVQN